MAVSLTGELRTKLDAALLDQGFDTTAEIDDIDNRSTSQQTKITEECWFNLRDPRIYDAFQEFAGGNISDNVINYLLGPVQFWHYANSWDGKFDDNILAWLMDPLPQDHPWISLLSDDQKKFSRSGWTVEDRYLYGYPITRLEYWSTAWCKSEEGAHLELNVGPWTLASSTVDVGFALKSTDLAAEFPTGQLGADEWMAAGTKWHQKIFDLNQRWWTDSSNIILTIWGNVYKEGKQTKTADSSMTMNLFKKKSGWKAQHMAFLNMLCTNQNKGTQSVTTSTALGGLFWWTEGAKFEDNPWVTDGSTNQARWQWLFTGKETVNDKDADPEANIGDPVNISIIQKLLYTEHGYNQPFKLEAMGWREIKAFMKATSHDADGKPETISMAAQAAYLNTLTADTFLEQVLFYLKAEGAVQVWDGALKESAGVLGMKSTVLRDGDLFREALGPDPAEVKGPPVWKSKEDKEDGEDWDTGLFYWEDPWPDQIESVDEKSEGDRHVSKMGLSRLHYWLLPKANLEDHWLKVGGKDPHKSIWEDYNDAIKCLAAGSFETFPGDTWKQNWVVVGLLNAYGAVALGGVPIGSIAAADDDSSDQQIVTAGSSDAKMPTKKSYVKASAFTDWEGLLKGKPGENTKVNSAGAPTDDAGKLKAATDLLSEGSAFTPDQVDLGEAQPITTRDFTFDLATDVNNLPDADGNKSNKLKGTGWDAEAASSNEAAAATVKTVKDAFMEFAGSKEKGYGPPKSQATAQWFRDNFKTNQLVPRADAINGADPLSFSFDSISSDTGKQALKDMLTAGGPGTQGDADTIKMIKPEYPWSTVVYPNSQAGEVPFAELLRMYQGAAYMTALHYRMARQNHDNVKTLLTDIWDHYAFKCAYHFYRIWERQLHDHQVGNLYAIICILLARLDDTDENAAEAMKALIEGLQGADDKAMEGQTTAPPPEIEEEDESSKDQREKFYKQCALLLNMHNLVARYDMSGIMHEKSVEAEYSSYNGRIHLVSNQGAASGQNNTILNKLITPTPSDMKAFTEIAPDKASELLPYIRFFRVWTDPDKNLQEVEFDFPQFGTREMNETFDRGDGVGLQEFTWECDGETPATASKYINATLTLTFQSFDDFTRERMNKANIPFRWVDMFVSPTSVVAKGSPKTDTPHHLRYDSEYYRIRVDLGYHPSVGGSLGTALNSQNRSFFLVLKDNEITINKDMSVTIQANYGAYIEEAMDSNKFNALTTPDIKKAEDGYKQQWAAATKSYKEGGCDDKQLRQIRATINAQLEDLIKKQHKSVMTNLLNLERIFHVDMEAKHIDNYRQAGAFTSIPVPTDGDKVKPGSDAANTLRQKMMAMDNPDRKSWAEANEPHKDYRIYYFYLGDLIYLLNSAMYENGTSPWNSKGLFEDVPVSGAENTKLLLMDFDYHNPLVQDDSTRKSINIAHIPISVDFFFQWYVNNIIKNEIYSMGVGNFIKRMLTELITEALAEVCLSSEEGHYVSFQHGSISVAGNSVTIPNQTEPMFTDPITSMMLMLKDDASNPHFFDVHEHYNKAGRPAGMKLPFRFVPDNQVLQQHNRNGVQGQFQYMYIYGDTKDPFHIGRGLRDEDNIRGCYHLDLARNNGLVKNISFSKNNIPYLRESRMFNQGQAGLLQLSAVYDCEIEMIGNTLFLPGQEVWVNPYGFGGESFGKPQDPPLKWSPSHLEINQFNDIVDRIEEDGNVTPEEMEEASEYLDDLDTVVAARTTTSLVVDSYANVMGIGGYQLIIRTKNTIKPGEFSTTISAKHTFTGYPMLKQSLDLVEWRQGRPASVADSDSGSGDNACADILSKWEDDPLN